MHPHQVGSIDFRSNQMFSKKTMAVIGAKKNNKWQRALARAARSSIEPLEGRVLLAYTLDSSFSGDGIATDQGGGSFVVQADNKIIAAINDSLFNSPHFKHPPNT